MRKNKENFGVADSKANKDAIILLTDDTAMHHNASHNIMAKRRTSVNLNVRKTADDEKLLKLLKEKLGVAPSQIVRLGLRRLAESEGISLKAS
jgi:hypothetical protein